MRLKDIRYQTKGSKEIDETSMIILNTQVDDYNACCHSGNLLAGILLKAGDSR